MYFSIGGGSFTTTPLQVSANRQRYTEPSTQTQSTQGITVFKENHSKIVSFLCFGQSTVFTLKERTVPLAVSHKAHLRAFVYVCHIGFRADRTSSKGFRLQSTPSAVAKENYCQREWLKRNSIGPATKKRQPPDPRYWRWRFPTCQSSEHAFHTFRGG